MKFSLLTTIFVLALAHGTFAADSTDSTNFEQIQKNFQKAGTDIAEGLTSMLSNNEMVHQIHGMMKTSGIETSGLAEEIQSQLKTASTNMGEQFTVVLGMLQKMAEQAKPSSK